MLRRGRHFWLSRQRRAFQSLSRLSFPELVRQNSSSRIRTGTQAVSIYDFQYGLLSGDYYVVISLEGIPGSKIVGYFRIG